MREFDPAAAFHAAFDEALGDTLRRSPSFGKHDLYVSPNRGKPKNEAYWHEEGPRMVQRWIDWRAETGWTLWRTPTGLPGVELELNFTIGDDIPIKGFIDSVFTLPTGKLAVVDVKSGKIPDTPGQLGLYRLGLQKLFGVDADWGFFWDAKKGTHGQPLDLTSYTEDFMADLFEQAIRGHNAGVFLPKPQMNCATWCSVSRYCTAVGGELSHSVPSLRDMLTFSTRDNG